MLNYLKGLAFLKKTVGTSSIRRVLEIGGGYGTLGEIFLKSDYDNSVYIDVDIPPAAYVATRYLQKVFGETQSWITHRPVTLTSLTCPRLNKTTGVRS